MTKEELAKKKGIKYNKESQNPADALVTKQTSAPKKDTTPEEEKAGSSAKKIQKSEKPSAPIKSKQKTTATSKTAPAQNKEEKRGPGKPRKRKDGDKKISFWLDEDLVKGLYGQLHYGESAGDLINTAIREYQKKHKTYEK